MKNIIIPVVCLIIGLVAGYFIGDYLAVQRVKTEMAKSIEEAFNIPDTEGMTEEEKDNPVLAEQNALQEEIDSFNKIEKQIGEEIELATMNFTVNSVDREETIQGFGQPKVADEGTEFIVVNVTANNTTKATFDFSPNGFILIGEDETVYSTYSDSIGSIEDYMDYKELPPKIAQTGNLVYQLPKGEENVTLNVRKSGTEDLYSVSLD
jgi:hypothetical protein